MENENITAPSREDFNNLASQVKSIAELVKTGKEEAKEQVSEIVKQVLANHPGHTPERTVEFPDAGKEIVGGERVIFKKMPKELRDLSDQVLLCSKILGRDPRSLKSYSQFRNDAHEYVKALDTAASGGGTEWVPTDFSPELEKMIRLEQRVAPLFRSLPMPSSPYTLPIQVGKVTTVKQAEQTADTGQTKIAVGDGSSLTGSATLTAVNHAARVLVSKELEEDSIIPIIPWLMEEIATGFAEGRDDGILNGDTAGTHEDSDTTAATSRRKMWLGLRATANDQSYKTDLSTFSTTTLRSLRSSMGKFSVNPRDLVWVTGPVGFFKLLGLAEVLTVDKYGPQATVLSGELGKFDGIPIVVSEQVREDLNASGVYDGVTTTKTALYLANRRGHIFGDRRGFQTQVLREVYVESGQDALIATERKAFRDLFPIASNQTVRIGYNIA